MRWKRRSRQRHIDKIHTPLILTHGTWRRRNFSASRATSPPRSGRRASPVQLIVGKGYNHYEMGETLGHPTQSWAGPRWR